MSLLDKAVGLSVAILVMVLITLGIIGGMFGFLPFAQVDARVYQVVDDKILNENGQEVVWRGVGCSYLFHSDDYIAAWELHLPQIRAMNVNTIRLSFRFSFDRVSEADILDYSKLDQVLDLLCRNSIRAILDNHGGEGFGSQELSDAWKALATRHRGDSRIVAYELFNEPFCGTWDKQVVKSKDDVVEVYRNLTHQIREVDPDHIHVWQSSHYLPPLEEIRERLEQNIVFTVHRWWTNRPHEFEIWSPEELANLTVGYVAEMRSKLGIPFWLGEFGTHAPFHPSNPEWLLTKQILHRCEEHVLGWNLWMGRVAKDIQWNHYLDFFPLETHNHELVRVLWHRPSVTLSDFLVDQSGVDFIEYYRMEIRQFNDYATFEHGIVVLVVVVNRLPDDSVETVSLDEIEVYDSLTIRNQHVSSEGHDNYDIVIYMLN